jgi:hypothetical protein
MSEGGQMEKAIGRLAKEKRRNWATNRQEELRLDWIEENAAAIGERRSWMEAHGTPLADLQVLKLD